MDVAVDLVESYLRLNGNFFLTEFAVQRNTASGQYETVTDVDVVAVRLPRSSEAEETARTYGYGLVVMEDDALGIDAGSVDVILGEVKEGEAQFNPGLKRPEVLHAPLDRVAWLCAPFVDEAVADLERMSLWSGAVPVECRFLSGSLRSGEPERTRSTRSTWAMSSLLSPISWRKTPG